MLIINIVDVFGSAFLSFFAEVRKERKTERAKEEEGDFIVGRIIDAEGPPSKKKARIRKKERKNGKEKNLSKTLLLSLLFSLFYTFLQG